MGGQVPQRVEFLNRDLFAGVCRLPCPLQDWPRGLMTQSPSWLLMSEPMRATPSNDPREAISLNVIGCVWVSTLLLGGSVDNKRWPYDAFFLLAKTDRVVSRVLKQPSEEGDA